MTYFPSSCSVVFQRAVKEVEAAFILTQHQQHTAVCSAGVGLHARAHSYTPSSVIFLSPFMLILLSFTFVSVSAKK